MPSLTLVIGRPSASRQSAPFPVYVGLSGSEANAAMEQSAAANFEIFRSVHGLRKNNPRAAANAARAIAFAQATSAASADLAAQLSRLTEENVALKQKAEAQAASIAAYAAEVEQLKANAAAAAVPAKKSKA